VTTIASTRLRHRNAHHPRTNAASDERIPSGLLASPEDPQPRAADHHIEHDVGAGGIAELGRARCRRFSAPRYRRTVRWEAPFSNAFYSWDAAIPADPRGYTDLGVRTLATTKRFGPTSHATERCSPPHTASPRSRSPNEVSASDPASQTNDESLQSRPNSRMNCARATSAIDLRRDRSAFFERCPAAALHDARGPAIRATAAAGNHCTPCAPRSRTRGNRRSRSSAPRQRHHGLGRTRRHLRIAVNWSDAKRTYGGATWTGTRNQNVRALPSRRATRASSFLAARAGPGRRCLHYRNRAHGALCAVDRAQRAASRTS